MVVHVDDRILGLLRHMILRNHHGPGPVFLELQVGRALARRARLLAFDTGGLQDDQRYHRKPDETWNARPVSTLHSHRKTPQAQEAKFHNSAGVVLPSGRILAREDPVHAQADLFDITLVTAAHFRRNPASVIDLAQRLANVGPVDALAAPVLGIELWMVHARLEAFDVNFDEPVSYGPDPILRVAGRHDVADIEIRLDVRALELVDVAHEFERTEQEAIPHIFDRDYHLQLAG